MILRHITIDAENPYELAQFWSTTTGWPLGEGDEPGDDEVLVEAPAPVPGLLFIRVPESKTVKNRVHIDWVPTERTRDEEVERLVGLGASIHEDHRTPEGPGWVTMLDPEQNEFCVERSEAERAT
ncbi:VOC family protein [Kribbella albertanoniae]|uniref:VOC family protein n=1 Tax=Kribbella albertanoniae TaxID=1266829 RepID=A0A4R4QJI0_9ACTN|nr:VOC family protein [Kribbella albertanoniae]TDC35898.1 VOC family protein [Kribbella albertanoniae]